MKIVIFGAAGFIGTNLTLKLSENKEDFITLIDAKKEYFHKDVLNLSNTKIIESSFDLGTNFEQLLNDQDVVYHLVSTTVPSTSNLQISNELLSNVIVTSNLLDACVKCDIKKVIFMSSGGTVYGKEVKCPLNEETPTYPITSYGIQKITIEKLLYLYNYLFDLDYRVIRLSNPYGPYQRPNGILGAVTTFSYKALNKELIEIYGDGTVVRDFIYIDDAINGIINISKYHGEYKTFNLGCGKGTSINDVIDILKSIFKDLNIKYSSSRKVDVPCNFLDISRYEKVFGPSNFIDIQNGISKTIDYLKNH